MYKSRYFKVLIVIILILLVIYLGKEVGFFLTPLISAFSIIISSLLFGGFLYYLMRPTVRFLARIVTYKTVAIIIAFLLIISIVSLTGYLGGSVIKTEVDNLVKLFSNYYNNIRQNEEVLVQGRGIWSFLKDYGIQEKMTRFAENMFNAVKNNLLGFFVKLTNIGTVLVLLVIVLLYFLKDDKEIYRGIINIFPEDRQKRARKVVKEIDETLARYIGGQIIVALLLGLLTYLGYLIIGLPNAITLALFATILNFIPFIGPIIGILPAIFVAFSTSIYLVLKVLLVLLVVQQLEGNVIQPKIQGDRLKIHPLTVIFMIIIFVLLFGFLGSLFAVPAYAIMRILAVEFNLKKKIFSD